MIFWFFRALNKTYTTDLQYPIEFVYDNPDSFCVVKPLPQTIDVELKGGGWVLLSRAMEYSSAPIKIPLQTPTQTKRILTSSLRSLFKNYFQDVEFLATSPDSFSIDIEKKVKKQIKLYLDPNKIALAPQYKLEARPILKPDSVLFTGPESYIQAIPDSIEVSITTKDINKNLNENIDIEPFNSKLIRVSPNHVTAEGKVTKLVETRRKIYAHLIHFPKKLSVQDSACWINYSVEEPFNNELSDLDFNITIDYNHMRTDSTILPELISFPAQLESIQLDTVPLRVCKRRKSPAFL